MKKPSLARLLTQFAVRPLILLFVVGLLNPRLWADEEANRPNIVVFLVDDYDKPETSVYGGNVLTPSLDRMAHEGMVFHEFHVTSTVCTPSRYTMLTGRYAGASTSNQYLTECPEGQQGLPAFNVELESDNMNVGHVLKQHGYATGFVGKYHVGPHINEDRAGKYGWRPIPKNAAYSASIEAAANNNQQRACELIRERGFEWVKNIYWENMKAPFKGHNPEWTIDAALEFIDEHKNGPFYLHYATTLLHGPNKEWFRSLDKPLITNAGMLKRPLGLMDRSSVMKRIANAGLTENEAGYLWMDDSLGMLLNRLDKHGIADNTIVVFVADHGSNHKGSLMKSRGTEVPCLIRWPKGIAPGSTCRELVQSTDLVATWFDVANVNLPSKYRLDGISMSPLFRDPTKAIRNYVYAEMGPARSIKTRDWSYIALRYTTEQIASIRNEHRSVKQLMGLSGGVSRARTFAAAFDVDQLYELNDESEGRRNLAAKPRHSQRLTEMKRMLLTELRRFPNRPFGEFVLGGNAVPGQEQSDLAPLLKKFAANQE